MKALEEYVTAIPDFPEKGIIFRDITTILQDKDGLKLAIDGMAEKLEGVDYDLIAGPESRGFIFGTPLAYRVDKGFVMIRKKGKLPRETISEEYELEYGKATIEVHKDAIKPGQKVVLVDDLIATGGSAAASIKLIERLGGKVVKVLFVIELKGLKGRDKLKGYDVESLIAYEGN
ncbi:MAG: adenine phosphoribosyltransferase [Candidatus Methanomethylophilaceae archaeon]|jgi:adenine phosphoribosyltransferase|nr:adenine phosphoribosyltransferase [Candidatus Methanomethylophilaceae archaeon]